jgi:hypothetical protein
MNRYAFLLGLALAALPLLLQWVNVNLWHFAP